MTYMPKQKQQIRELYPRLKADGMLYMVIGSCISSDNEDRKDVWEYNLHILEELLAGAPPTDTKEVERLRKGIGLINNELKKFD